jgi:hypothetical protein
MSFEPNSRYAHVEVARRTVTDRHGDERVIAYVRRRRIPSYEDQPSLAEHRVVEGDRLDNVTARYIGDPTQFWRLCDANLVLRPEELEVVGRVVRVAMARD